MTDSSVVLTTEFPELPLFSRGKVRDIYDLGESLLIVATDRISAFDVVMADGVPDKGCILTALSLFWFDLLRRVAPFHLITADPAEYPRSAARYADLLRGRSMLVKKARMLPIECVARGYLAGSGWKEYQAHGTVCGIRLPEGLQESSKLPYPIFTPATKAEIGDHDENIDDERGIALVGNETYQWVKRKTLELYEAGAAYAADRGVIIADTKFEFGWHDGRVILADEILTPDSSRFWPADTYEPGRGQQSYDKQYLRDYLESIGWDKTPPPPPLPAEVIAGTREKYLEAYRQLVGKPFSVGAT